MDATVEMPATQKLLSMSVEVVTEKDIQTGKLFNAGMIYTFETGGAFITISERPHLAGEPVGDVVIEKKA